MHPKLIAAATEVMEDFKSAREMAMAAGGTGDIDIAIYLHDAGGDVYLGHTEIIDRPLPPRKFVKAVHELVRALRNVSTAPWTHLAMCVDTWTAPNVGEFVDVGSMSRDFAENPATPVQRSIAVFVVDSEGMSLLAYTPFTLGDNGEPVWGMTRFSADPPGIAPATLAHAALA